MAEGMRLNQLQDGLNGFKKTTESQLMTLEVEMLAIKKQLDSMVQQLAALTLGLKKKNNEHQQEDSTSGTNSRFE